MSVYNLCSTIEIANHLTRTNDSDINFVNSWHFLANILKINELLLNINQFIQITQVTNLHNRHTHSEHNHLQTQTCIHMQQESDKQRDTQTNPVSGPLVIAIAVNNLKNLKFCIKLMLAKQVKQLKAKSLEHVTI